MRRTVQACPVADAWGEVSVTIEVDGWTILFWVIGSVIGQAIFQALWGKC